MKKWQIVFVLLVAVLILLFVVCVSACTFLPIGMAAMTYLSPNPPAPEIKYAEFPFELIYEIDGEIVAINDLYVCEFVGFEGDSANLKKKRKWNGYIKGTGESGIMIFEKTTEDRYLQINCYVGYPEYYMSEEGYESQSIYTPSIVCNYVDDKWKSATTLEYNELWEQYKIRIISWEFSEPIKNTYK